MKNLIFKRIVAVFIAVLFVLALWPSLPTKAEGEEIATTTVVSIDYDQDNNLIYSVNVYDADNNPVNGGTVNLYYRNSTSARKINVVNGFATYTYCFSNGSSFDVYADYSGVGNYAASTSERTSVAIVKQTAFKYDNLTTTPSVKGGATGTISVNDGKSYAYLRYRKEGTSTYSFSEGNVISGVPAGKYIVGLAAYRDGNTFYLGTNPSSKSVTVGEDVYSITLAGSAKWKKNGSTVSGTVETAGEETFTVSASQSGYVVDSVSISPELSGTVSYDKASGQVSVSGIRGKVTLTANVRPLETYTVNLDTTNGIKWQNNGTNTSFTVKENSTNGKSVYPVAPKGYYVESVSFIPNDASISSENAATINFNFSTREVYVTNVKTSGTLVATLAEDTTPVTLELSSIEALEEADRIGIDLSGTGRIKYTFLAKDELGNPSPKASVYFKDDTAEVSYRTGTTDANGYVSFIATYTLGTDDKAPADGTRKSFTAIATIDKNNQTNDNTVTKDITLIKQARPASFDVGNITASKANESNGEIHNFPEEWEYFTEPLKGGEYFSTGDGDARWATATNGDITGLSAGWYAVRIKEYFDKDSGEFYLASYHSRLQIPVGRIKITANVVDSENVVFDQLEVYAEHNGDVSLHVKAIEGYEILDENISVNRPQNVSTIEYQEGYIYLDGITNDITVTVKATEKEPIIYAFGDAAGTWIKGSEKTLDFRVLADYSKFRSVEIDNTKITDKDFDSSEGSTIINVLPSFLEGLDLGSHTIKINFSDGYAQTNFSVIEKELTKQKTVETNPLKSDLDSSKATGANQTKETPNTKVVEPNSSPSKEAKVEKSVGAKNSVETGDDFNLNLILLIFVISILAIPFVIIKKKKN